MLTEVTNGIQVALSVHFDFLILSRWEDGRRFTRILRLANGEVWVSSGYINLSTLSIGVGHFLRTFFPSAPPGA